MQKYYSTIGGGTTMSNHTKGFNALCILIFFIVSITAVVAQPTPTQDTLSGIAIEDFKINGRNIDNNDDVRDVFDRGEKIHVEFMMSSRDWLGQEQPACVNPDGTPVRENGNVVVPDANGACANGAPGVFRPVNTAEVLENVLVIAAIAGDERFPLVQVQTEHKIKANTRKLFEFDIEIPRSLDLEEGDDYNLVIQVIPRDKQSETYEFSLNIGQKTHAVIIRDVVISPSRQVLAGRPFTVMARIQNLGEKDEETVKVIAKVPAFGLVSENAEFIDEIEGGPEDDAVTSEQIYLRIPAEAQPGLYDVVVEVVYDEYTKKETAVTKIEVVNPNYQAPQAPEQQSSDEPAQPKGKTVITVGPEMQDVVKGQGGAIYPVTIANQGATAKNYVVGIAGTEPFATVQLSPSNIVTLDPSATETVYVYVSAREDAQVGAHTFAVEVRSADKLLQQVSLTANVVEGAPAKNDLRKGLEVGLIVLIVVLIILGLIIAFARSRKNDDEPVAGQAYY